ncbi:3-oxoacyl-[acyl-carrier protein] reductase [Nocardioides psychrotolerans]|uniref:3-oxoacyl-[acyl-carrier protein] reductase n=1 Tax=Nocardioides psychrotolerans TaxID=1005945 RepID=A0A1I3H1C3_9ACTN|nr:3-oxoacyl-[acyl-carrier protein] reductase [Nocardioides psychrotolerans]
MTGVSRRRGIGFAVASRLVDAGASVVVHHHGPHDVEEYGDADDVDALLDALRGRVRSGAVVAEVAGDLGSAEVPGSVLADAVAAGGHLDVLVCNHAHGGDAVSLADLTSAALDRHFEVNTRATLLLTRGFAEQHDGRRGGRVIWMTSGQGLGPMHGNLAYAVSKAALEGATATVADELVEAGILLNTVNPGPVNTGYLDDVAHAVVDRFPTGRLGRPDDPARLIAWLVSDEGEWMVGQVLHTEGGFRR